MTKEQREAVEAIVNKWITTSASKFNGAKSDVLTLAEVIRELDKAQAD